MYTSRVNCGSSAVSVDQVAVVLVPFVTADSPNSCDHSSVPTGIVSTYIYIYIYMLWSFFVPGSVN